MTPSSSSSHLAANLVTGALGFVGLHLVDSLLASGQPVVGVGRHDASDPLPDSRLGYRRTGDAPELPGAVRYEGEHGTFWYLPLALEDAPAVSALLDRLQPATIYHLAAQSSAAVSFRDPGDTFTSNVMGTLHLLEALRAQPEGARPVFLSVGSCEEYGPQTGKPTPLGEDAVLNPVSPYAVSKAAQTLLCRQYARSWDLPVVVARSFSHTGPGQDTRFALPSFARQIAAAEAGAGPTEIAVGDLGAVRDFLDVRDVVEAYRLLVAHGSPGGVYNVCSGTPLTIRQALDILLGAARRQVTVRIDPSRCRPSDTPYLVGDSTKLRTETGWALEHALDDTLLGLLQAARKEFA